MVSHSSARDGLENSLFHMTIFVFAADYKANVFALLQRIVPLQDKALVLGLDEGKRAGNTTDDASDPAANDALQGLYEGQVLLIERRIFGNDVHDVRRAAF